MSTCSIKFCGKNSRTSNYTKDGITFHRFPKCPNIKLKWINTTCRGEKWFPTNNSVVCSRHFTDDCFHIMKNRRRLMDTAVPTLFIPLLVPQPVTLNTDNTNETSAADAELARESCGPTSSKFDTLCEIQASGSETPKRKRKFNCDPTTPSAYDSPVKKHLCRRVIELKNTIKIKNKEIRKVRDNNRRLKRKITSLKSLLADLEAKNFITTENKDILSSVGVKCRELIKRQTLRGKSGKIVKKKYSPELRAFALTLCFYSSKAYNYVRKTFNSCLPHIKTLGKWYSTIDGSPGFTKEALEALKIKARQSPEPLFCSIIFDEMKIRTKIEKNYGYVNFGSSIDTDCREECTDALVYLVVPLHGKWKVPIGYFLINRVTAEQKVFLLTKAIELCNEVNIIIKAVTFDGCPANIAMVKKLGCKLDPDNLKTYFEVNNHKIAVFLDPAHMVKLVRNSFEHYRQFKNAEDSIISWQHIENLHEMQENEMFHAANKLRAEHLHFKKNIMKVKLATQLFSRSISIALKFCKNNLKLNQFQNVEATADFLLLVNDIFDILDSKVHGKKYKRALNIENSNNVLEKLDQSKHILLNLTVNLKNKTVRLVDSPRFTGFVGLCVCIESLKFLYYDLIQTNSCKYISFHRISQDHIELFFCNIRSRGGANDNPTPKQFHGIYRKMLVHMELQETNTGNCVSLEEISILNCSSAVQRINVSIERGDVEDDKEERPSDDCFTEAIQQISLSLFSESIIEYISGAVVHYLIKRIKCNKCVRSLVSLEENYNSLICARDYGGLIYPSKTVVKICRRCEQVIRRASSKICYNDKMRFVTKTMMTFINEDIFSELKAHQFDHESCNHIVELAKSVAEKYVDIRLLYLTRRSNPQAALRRVYTKLIHFKNQ